MTPEEIAMKFASSSAVCRGNRCPFASECHGTGETCKLKEVAMVVRSQCLELDKLRTEVEVQRGATQLIAAYCDELERINKAYYAIIQKFYDGYRPTAKPKKRVPRIGSARGRKKKSLIEMDGDERYAMPEEPRPQKDPVVII